MTTLCINKQPIKSNNNFR